MNQFLIVCPLLFLGGLVDAIGGGGGLITLPAYMLAGVPVHQAIATNKLSSTCGTALATVRFIREGLVNWRLAVPTVLMAVVGSTLGANLSLAVSAEIMEKVLVFVLPVVAIVGYTNAGKSTLLNQLTDAGIPANNRLFDTLDTTSRQLTVSDNLDVIL